MPTHDPVTQTRRYFDAWRHHDSDAILASMAPGGTYRDPTTPGPIGGEALKGYAMALWTAFPDLDFEVGPIECLGLDGHRTHTTWVMTGHNHGALMGLPPTGKAVRLEGIDLIETGPDGVRSVTGLFDSATLLRQMGVNVVVQPFAVGPIEFGTSTWVRHSTASRPGVIVVTELLARDDAAVEHIRTLSRQTVIEHLGNPALQGYTGAIAGRRMLTLTAWSSQEAMRSAMQQGTHPQAMREFFQEGIAEGGTTSVYVPLRAGPSWRRCGGCGAMARLDGLQGVCACGTAVEALA